MPKEENGYKMRMIVPKPTDPEKLKKREEISRRSREYPNEELKKALERVQAKDGQEGKEKMDLPKSTDPEKLKEREELLGRLGGISNEELKKALELIQAQKNQEEWVSARENEKNQALETLWSRRERWEKSKVSDEFKIKMKNVVNKIPLRTRMEKDWSRLIEFTLKWKKYRRLDVNAEANSDDDVSGDYTGIWSWNYGIGSVETIFLGWIEWDNVDNWKNRKLKKYVKEKQSEWFYIPKEEEMKNVLKELWEETGIEKEEDQIVMLAYLLGLVWEYWLGVRGKQNGFEYRNTMLCGPIYSFFNRLCGVWNNVQFFMMSCEEV